jgi:hypothetical protein
MDKAMTLDCGHKATKPNGQSVWFTLFFPGQDAPHYRFCDSDCVLVWLQKREAEFLRQLRAEHRQMVEEQGRDSYGTD